MAQVKNIVKFALERHNVKAKWKCIPLTYDKWKKLSMEKTCLDELAWKLEKQIKELMEKEEFKIENEELKRQLYEAFEMEKEIEKEYERVPTLEDNLNSAAMLFLVKPLKRLKKHRGKFPFYYKLFKKNKGTDFLILLNMQLTSGDSRREKLKTLVHETLHFIQHSKKTGTDFASIENEADRIVDEFLASGGEAENVEFSACERT